MKKIKSNRLLYRIDCDFWTDDFTEAGFDSQEEFEIYLKKRVHRFMDSFKIGATWEVKERRNGKEIQL